MVISRGEGPKYNGSNTGCLTPGKEYIPISIHYQKENGIWISDKFKFNPRKAEFYIKVIDDNGSTHDIWNDYFLSTEEMREFLLNKLEL